MAPLPPRLSRAFPSLAPLRDEAPQPDPTLFLPGCLRQLSESPCLPVAPPAWADSQRALGPVPALETASAGLALRHTSALLPLLLPLDLC